MSIRSLQRGPRARAATEWLCFFVLAGVAGLYALHAGRETVFRGDDWDLLFGRQGGGLEVYLSPHVDHLVAGQVIAYKAIVAAVGPRYIAFRVGLVVAVALLAGTLFVFLKRRLGPWVALPLVGLILFMGAGSDNLLWPTQLAIVLSVAEGIGALLLLESDRAGHRAWASLLLVGAVASGSQGLFFVLASGIWCLLDPGRRRAIWVPAVPAVLYAAWYVKYGSSVGGSDVAEIPRFAFELLAAGFAGLMGAPAELGYPDSKPAIWGIVGITLLTLSALYARPKVTPRLIAIVSLPIISCGVIALGRANGGDPYASRYALPTAVFILMAAGEAFCGRRIRLRGSVAIAACSLVAIVFSAMDLERVGDALRLESQDIRARVGALEDARRTVDPDYSPGPIPETGNLSAGWYLAGIEDFGRSAVGDVSLARLDEPARVSGDEVSAEAIPANLVAASQSRPVPADTPPPVITSGSAAPLGAGCLITVGATDSTEVEVPTSGLLMRAADSADLELRLRRFGATPPPNAFATISRIPRTLVIPGDLAGGTWLATISGPGDAVICAANAPTGLRRGHSFPAHGDQGCGGALLGVTNCVFDR